MIGKTTKVANDLLRQAHAEKMEELLTDTTVGGGEWDEWETTDRIFVRDLPIWERFLIWLFPRMYDIRSYDVEWHATDNSQESINHD